MSDRKNFNGILRSNREELLMHSRPRLRPIQSSNVAREDTAVSLSSRSPFVQRHSPTLGLKGVYGLAQYRVADGKGSL